MDAFQRNVKLCQKIFQRNYPRENLKEAIFFFNAESSAKKMGTVKKLYNFLKDLLKVERKTNEQNLENVFEKSQNKMRDVMGPLRKLWKILEDVKQEEDNAVQISVNEMLFYVEQIVLLLGQSSNTITRPRRLNVVAYIMNSQYQVKTMLKEKVTLLQ